MRARSFALASRMESTAVLNSEATSRNMAETVSSEIICKDDTASDALWSISFVVISVMSIVERNVCKGAMRLHQ